MASPIPIKNIYHLLCYAWDTLVPESQTDVDIAEASSPIDLLANVLINGTYNLLRRGVEQNYQPLIDNTASLRGKCLFAQSARRMLLQQGRVICDYDDLSHDTVPNQILKATLFRLSRLWGLNPTLRKKCGKLVKRFNNVTDIHLSAQVFHRIQLHSNNRFYKFLVHICELIYHECLLDEQTGRYRFQDFFRDTGSMARLYEKFLYNFLKKRQTRYQVTSERIYWNAQSDDDPQLNLLPSMLTDISLRNDDTTLIIDAKYYADLFQQYQSNKSFRSANLYQIYAYIKNLEKNGGGDAIATGMLLYPVTTESISSSYQLVDQKIRIETINLASEWKDVENQILDIVGCEPIHIN